ncbi:MAG: protein translocase subunit SecD [Planctomycetaceae bacterium]|nr:protein translocase subunit SecD [Planctomycetaceae bacterium]
MVENVHRKLILIGAVLGLAALFLALPRFQFRLGLDLQGGTRLVYRFDFDEEIAKGNLDANESRQEILRQTVGIIRERVDPSGVVEPRIVQEGEDRIVIELPGLGEIQGVRLVSALEADLGAGDSSLTLADEETAGQFPVTGGVVRIGDERVRYEERQGTRLLSLSRGAQSSARADHPAGAAVELVSDDAIRARIENLGELSFEIVAEAQDFTGTGTDLVEQRSKLAEWMATRPDAKLSDFNRVPTAEGGPHPYVRWVPAKPASELDTSDELARATPLLRLREMPDYKDRDWLFTGAHLARASQSQDNLGLPAVGFEFQESSKIEFARFTNNFKQRQMAIVLNGQVETSPVIRSELPGGGVIEGRYTSDDVQELVTVLRSGSLRLKPILEAEERIGPTLGADYVRRGALSGLVGIVAVLGFMVAYYRRLGLFSVVTLLANMLFLLGGMAFMKSTLTLPGLAGIVLTVGMAVDANILIFDRIREERDNGRNIKQAAKSGFQKAFVTIIDANLTTLITAIILYVEGTGPVKGFAVTLTIGILGTLFCSLVITRVLVHFALERGVKEFKMGTWLVTASYDWMGKRHIAVPASIAAVILFAGIFVAVPTKSKFGIDFLGGATLQVRTEQPVEVAVVRERVAGLGGDLSQATVTPLLASAEGDGKFSDFRIEFKLEDAGAAGSEELESSFQAEIRRGLGDLLQRGPIDVAVEGNTATIGLYFTEAHDKPDIVAAVATAGLADATVVDGSRTGSYRATGTVPAGQSPQALQDRLQNALQGTDSRGVEFALANPIPESTLVGNQVVGELRDKAILAVFLSLFAVVMYIRLRFAEYSYGFAAVLSLVHDVIIAMGAMALMAYLGILRTEITLTSIAAFLTIIGYSLNDTIIVFDRVRENLPRVEKPLPEVLNLSINQTLSRTIMTSGTTLLAVLILFVFNAGTGNALESFAFAMMIGVGVGTYSSIYIASPALLFFENRRIARMAAAKDSPQRQTQPA